MMDDAMEDYIIITTEYYWHWDLKGTGLNIWEYRKVMEKMMNAGGLQWYATDDPEICSHPANCLMVRIGNRVDSNSIESLTTAVYKSIYLLANPRFYIPKVRDFIMIIEEIMTTNIITLDAEQSIIDAYSLMIQHKIRHLPIVDKKNI